LKSRVRREQLAHARIFEVNVGQLCERPSRERGLSDLPGAEDQDRRDCFHEARDRVVADRRHMCAE
jgi:hypothetical protein